MVIEFEAKEDFDVIVEDGELFVSIKSLVDNLCRARAISNSPDPIVSLNNLIEWIQGIHVGE